MHKTSKPEGKRQRLRCWFDIGSLTLSQVIQQALHRPPSSAAQYLQQMYAAQQQHLMLHTAALQQQHLSSSQLQSLAAVQVRTQRTVCQIVTAGNKQAGVLSAFLTSVLVSTRGERYKFTGRRMDRFGCCLVALYLRQINVLYMVYFCLRNFRDNTEYLRLHELHFFNPKVSQFFFFLCLQFIFIKEYQVE